MPETPVELPAELLGQLLELLDRLRGETAGFVAAAGDQQAWYNRGYANGMLLALRELGQAAALGERVPDDPEHLAGHLVMAWGRAYRHGEAMGRRETFEITGNEPIKGTDAP